VYGVKALPLKLYLVFYSKNNYVIDVGATVPDGYRREITHQPVSIEELHADMWSHTIHCVEKKATKTEYLMKMT
jgi:hypothetical protein